MQTQTESSRNTRFHTENAGGTPENEAVLPWSIAVPNVKKMQFASVERAVRKCYQNSYSANISRIDREFLAFSSRSPKLNVVNINLIKFKAGYTEVAGIQT